MNCLAEIFELLKQVVTDPIVSKTVKLTAEQVIHVLEDECAAFELRRDKAIYLLTLTENSNMSSFTRSILYEVIAKLES